MTRPLIKCLMKINSQMPVSIHSVSKLFLFSTTQCGFNLISRHYSSNENKSLITFNAFNDIDTKDKNTYLDLIHIYKAKEKFRRGHVEFIYTALKHMEEFGVEKELEVYKALIDVMPKGKFIPQNVFQAEFMHYPKQQQCIIDLLEQMEENGVMPDSEMQDLLVNIFGRKAHPLRRYWRMMYWMPKFKHITPWPLPDPVPTDSLELGKLAIERITSVDVTTTVSVFQTKDVETSIDDTWIVSGQSVEQQTLLQKHPVNKPIYVEGSFRIWLKKTSVNYFILRGDPVIQPTGAEDIDPDDVTRLIDPLFNRPEKNISPIESIHEQEDGIIYAVCATGSSSRDSLLSWIRILEKENPKIAEIPVLFTLKSPLEESEPTKEIEAHINVPMNSSRENVTDKG